MRTFSYNTTEQSKTTKHQINTKNIVNSGWIYSQTAIVVSSQNMTGVNKAQSWIFLWHYDRSNISEAISPRFPSCIFTEAAELVTNVSQQERWSPRTAMEDTQAIKLGTESIQTTTPAARGGNSTLKLWNRCRSWQRNRAVAFSSTIFLYGYKSQKHLCWKLPLTSNFSTIISWDEVQMRTWLDVNLFICRTCLAEKVMHWHF